MSEGNKQDMSVLDVENASLAATQEAQDMSTLDRVIVPMPSFTDPHNPDAATGSINFSLDTHPVEHSQDYGDTALDDRGVDPDFVPGVLDVTTGAEGTSAESDKPREEWTKADYKAKLHAAGLPVSGNMDDLQTRYEEYEAMEAEYADMNAEDWKGKIEDAETADDLASLKSAYERSGADYSTVEDAFDRKYEELNNPDEN